MVCVGFCGNAFSVHVPNIGCRFTGAFVTSYGLLTAAAAIFAGSSFFPALPAPFSFKFPASAGNFCFITSAQSAKMPHLPKYHPFCVRKTHIMPIDIMGKICYNIVKPISKVGKQSNQKDYIMAEILKITNLKVGIEEKELLHGISLTVNSGETHVLMGPNGAGKSTLGLAIMGSPEYTVTGGSIFFNGADITTESPDHRAKQGLFLSFQNPVEIPGISLSDFMRNALENQTGQRIKLWDFKKQLKAAMDVLQMDPAYADRDLNVGFSGGEKKKSEILQLLMLKPKLAILDETDSGLDVDAVRTVSLGIHEYVQNCGGSLLIITHNTKMLRALDVDQTHIIVNGTIAAEGGSELVRTVDQNGFEQFLNGK